MGAAAGTTSAATCGLTAMTMAAALGQSADGGIEPQAAIGKRGDLWRRVWLDHRDVRWTKPKAKPAIEQGTPHFAGAHEYEQAGQVTQIGASAGGRI